MKPLGKRTAKRIANLVTAAVFAAIAAAGILGAVLLQGRLPTPETLTASFAAEAQEAEKSAVSQSTAIESTAVESAADESAAGQSTADSSAPVSSAVSPASSEPERSELDDPEPDDPELTCTVAIRCDTILQNLGALRPEKAPYVPADGCVLPETREAFAAGETVFDVLKRVCEREGIQLEFSWTPAFGSSYIEGIHHLYEFDCGPESGWMYQVNGQFPNYGCSAYELRAGDRVVWLYTCRGLGADVGAPGW